MLAAIVFVVLARYYGRGIVRPGDDPVVGLAAYPPALGVAIATFGVACVAGMITSATARKRGHRNRIHATHGKRSPPPHVDEEGSRRDDEA
jgi:hypothetical protein